MADAIDVLTLAEGRAAVGQDTATVDSSLDTQLELYITATSQWLDAICGPMVSRALLTCAVNTAATTLEFTSPTEKLFEEIAVGDRVDIGTAADPWLKAADRTVTQVDRDLLTITIDGDAITTATSDFVRQGRFIATANVDAVVKLAATAHLRWAWAVERGAASRNFDEFGNVGETLAVPRRVLDMVGDYFRPGAV